MVIYKKYGSYIYYHPLRTYRCIPYCTILCPDKIKSTQNYTLVMRKVVCIVNLVALLLCFMGDSVLKVDISGVAKKKSATSGFGLQVILVGSLCVSVICKLQIHCGIISKLD